MELINHAPSLRDKKRTFIALMAKCNPYRIKSIKDSVYSKILMSREAPREPRAESCKNPRAIYLPPVKAEESSIKILKQYKPTFMEIQRESMSTEEPPELTFQRFQILSRSLNFEDTSCKEKLAMRFKAQNHIKKETKDSASTAKSSNCREQNLRTMSASQNRQESFKLPSRFKESKSPWAFQAFNFFSINQRPTNSL